MLGEVQQKRQKVMFGKERTGERRRFGGKTAGGTRGDVGEEQRDEQWGGGGGSSYEEPPSTCEL